MNRTQWLRQAQPDNPTVDFMSYWFELITDHPKSFIIDPVCRMIISDEANAVQHPEMDGILFCSAHCMDIYRRNKEKQDVN